MCEQQRPSLQRWIGALQSKYPSLSKATIIYDIIEQEKEVSEECRTEQAKLNS